MFTFRMLHNDTQRWHFVLQRFMPSLRSAWNSFADQQRAAAQWLRNTNKDWGCVILREIDFLLKICWSIPCLHPSWKVHTWSKGLIRAAASTIPDQSLHSHCAVALWYSELWSGLEHANPACNKNKKVVRRARFPIRARRVILYPCTPRDFVQFSWDEFRNISLHEKTRWRRGNQAASPTREFDAVWGNPGEKQRARNHLRRFEAVAFLPLSDPTRFCNKGKSLKMWFEKSESKYSPIVPTHFQKTFSILFQYLFNTTWKNFSTATYLHFSKIFLTEHKDSKTSANCRQQ